MNASELAWFKSSYSSDSSNPDCVEIAHTPGTTHIRDSKNPTGPHLTVPPAAWAGFVAYAIRS
ncbi:MULTISPECIES: DUF397 domain-containing protein [unclassified Streptomyces]|uniref:DUF397 domain-containing protein n=1 Tax=unclassified Streptomyces TaxID=2593676 RepID=UPI000DB9025B|nr:MULTISPECIES: DUF397 domain-containing protein [unclassified Streptomyces]MYT69999.1 DUF397 domain-containing protein [Streptomyces sp. SID8367]RAJ88575.1 uncharacterized protein DUF397 [Streptomyces sp. PsTaAH-137]